VLFVACTLHIRLRLRDARRAGLLDDTTPAELPA